MFADKARAYLREPPFRYSTNIVGSWPYPQSIGLSCKGLPRTNTGLLEESVNYGQSFILLGPGACTIKLFTAIIY